MSAYVLNTKNEDLTPQSDIQTSFYPENHVAEALCASPGLVRTGEVVVRLKLGA